MSSLAIEEHLPPMSWQEEEVETGSCLELEDEVFDGDLTPSRNSAMHDTERSQDGDSSRVCMKMTSIEEWCQEVSRLQLCGMIKTRRRAIVTCIVRASCANAGLYKQRPSIASNSEPLTTSPKDGCCPSGCLC